MVAGRGHGFFTCGCCKSTGLLFGFVFGLDDIVYLDVNATAIPINDSL